MAIYMCCECGFMHLCPYKEVSSCIGCDDYAHVYVHAWTLWGEREQLRADHIADWLNPAACLAVFSHTALCPVLLPDPYP